MFCKLQVFLIAASLYLSTCFEIVLQEYSAFESEMNAKAIIFNKLAKLVDSKSSISIAAESWREIDIVWKKLEAQVHEITKCSYLFRILSFFWTSIVHFTLVNMAQ